MAYNYGIIGAGRQGIAAAYDLIKHGNPDKVYLFDFDENNLEKSRDIITNLTSYRNLIPVKINLEEPAGLLDFMFDLDGVLSAAPYKYNYELTKLAIETRTHFVDLGGNTAVSQKQLELDTHAIASDITVIPDCGMDPGLNISLIQYILESFTDVTCIKSYGAGLTQFPKPPWNFELTFNINGLTNEYNGEALFIRHGELVKVKALTEDEIIEFPDSLGDLDAAVTTGGLSTLPYELEGKIDTLENKTLRYPGHWCVFRAFSDLGLFNENEVQIDNRKIVPRDVFHHLLEEKITNYDIRDIGILRIFAKGIRNGEKIKLDLELIDYYDEDINFTAMQRLTGWHASIMLLFAVQGNTASGAMPVHKAVAGKKVLDEIRKRGIKVSEYYEVL